MTPDPRIEAIRQALGDPEQTTPDDYANEVRDALAALDSLAADLARCRGHIRALLDYIGIDPEDSVEHLESLGAPRTVVLAAAALEQEAR